MPGAGGTKPKAPRKGRCRKLESKSWALLSLGRSDEHRRKCRAGQGMARIGDARRGDSAKARQEVAVATNPAELEPLLRARRLYRNAPIAHRGAADKVRQPGLEPLRRSRRWIRTAKRRGERSA